MNILAIQLFNLNHYSFIIEKYIKAAKLNDEDMKIVKSWKMFIKEKFLIIKDLKKYSIFLDIEKEYCMGLMVFLISSLKCYTFFHL